MAVDISHVPGATGSLVALLDGTVKKSAGSWAAGSESEVVKLAMSMLEDAGAMVSLGPKQAKGFKRLTAAFPDTNVAYVITLDKDHVYIVRTALGST